MATVVLPNVAGSRALADRLIDGVKLDLESALRIDGRNLDINTDSFLLQIVKRISDAGLTSFELVGGGQQWYDAVREAARSAGITAVVADL
ncbi:hypothetical protein GCM10009715_35660 [Paeniglutamicibacter psychrophenolicus]|uniref:STAS domain-containing protein n=1 Tax=Paeniglutamicibacter psychrophenolicus TaxID=257454 RepID=A0ABS4WAC9_9MICC|nr:hypothetical protein [Paeniglutamicibacter psychrophenolicus]MBP2373155.1 hypothetical protein [Paeniglutamicibacter psychrophenolicus]